MTQGKPLDPHKTMCVVKHKGKEVGRVAASAAHASTCIDGLVRHYGDVQVEYVEDAEAALISQMLAPRRRG